MERLQSKRGQSALMSTKNANPGKQIDEESRLSQHDSGGGRINKPVRPDDGQQQQQTR